MAVDFEKVAEAVFDSKAVMFGDFVLKDGSHSPIYFDLRKLRSFPHEKYAVVSAYQELLAPLRYHSLADIPTAATPFVSSLSDRLAVPQITPRTDIKTHGTGAKIDGVYKAGELIVVVDDLITKATSKLEAIKALEDEKLIVRDVVVLIDRQQGGEEELDNRGYRLHSFTTMTKLAAYYRGHDLITSEQLEKTLALVRR